MTTIYSPKNAISKGLIEIIALYPDEGYYDIYLDGKHMFDTEGDRFGEHVTKHSFIKECVKKSKVAEEDLVFVLIYFEDYASQYVSDYDSNDYLGEYKAMQDFIAENGEMPASYFKVLAKGVTKLEKVVDKY